MVKSQSANDDAQSQWHRLQEAFERYVQLPKSERELYLQEHHRDEPELQAELRELADSFDASEALLEQSPIGSLVSDSDNRLPEVEGYELIRLIHGGGQGMVYLAIQLSTKRKVALKFMLAGTLAGDANKLRFEREVELIGRLQHPGLVSVFDSGIANNQYFYAMEYVEGRRLDEYVRSRELSIRKTLELFVDICQAVNYAQQNGVIHRDLKPSNILVDKHGISRVVDFGLAKSVHDDIHSAPTVSMTGQVMGTLEYMSPEQASGKSADIDTRTDVYSLGVVLFDLLTGEFPYALDSTLADNLTAIQSSDPDVKILRSSGVNSELTTIILKALQKEKQRRYQTAGAMGDDITRYLAGDPIEAKRDSAAYIVRKMLRKKWKATLALAAFMLLVALSSIVSFGLYLSAIDATQIADQNAALYQQQRDTGFEQLYIAEMNLAGQSLGQDGGIRRIKQLVDSWTDARSGKDFRGWEWYFLQSLCDREIRSLDHGTAIWTLQWHPIDDRILFGDGLGRVGIWNEKAKKKQFVGKIGLQVRAVGWSCDGSHMAGAGPAGPLRVWREKDGENTVCIPHDEHVLTIAWHPTNRRVLAFADINGLIRIWDVFDQREISKFEVKQPVQSIQWSQDGTQLTLACQSARFQVWNIDPPAMAWENTEFERPVFSARQNPIGDLVAASGVRGDITIVQAQDNHVRWRYDTQQLNSNLCWSPDGDLFASVGNDRVLRLFMSNRNLQATTFEGHSAAVWGLDWKTNSSLIATGSHDGTIKVWDAQSARPSRVVALPVKHRSQFIRSLDWHPNGNVVAAGGLTQDVFLIEPASGSIMGKLSDRAPVEKVNWSHDGKLLAVAGSDNQVLIWDVAGKKVAQRFLKHSAETTELPDQPEIVHSVAWSPDQQLVASCCQLGSLLVWEPNTGNIVARHREQWLVSTADWHPSRRRVAFASYYGFTVKLWDFDNDQEPPTLLDFDSGVIELRWSPDGNRLAACNENGVVTILDPDNPGSKLTMRNHTGSVLDLAWSPDGRRLATCSEDRTIKIWDTATGAQTLSFEAHDVAATCVAWSPDGKQLASAGRDQLIKFWDASRGYQRAGPSSLASESESENQ